MSDFKYIILPARGFKSPEMTSLAPKGNAAKAAADGISPFSAKAPGGTTISIVGSIGEDGPKAADMTPEEAREFRRDQDMRIAPLRKYRTARAPLASASPKALGNLFKTNAKTQFKITVQEAGSNKPLGDVAIVALVDPLTGAGIRRRTGALGEATLTIPDQRPVRELFVYPPPGYWGKCLKNLKLATDTTIDLIPLDQKYPDLLRKQYKTPGQKTDGKGVRVAVIDTGVDGSHPDLAGVKCFNFVTGEQPGDLAPSDGHGTHVAGIIAGKNHGLAPGVELYSYKVFPHSGPTSNWDISRAINQAVKDKCDLINLSLGGVQTDSLLGEAIGHAYENGVVCVVAAGNTRRNPVAYPAWFKRSLAVSAIGQIGTFPEDSVQCGDISSDRSSLDKSLFFAAFSNHGREIDICAPGVGIVSTWLGKGYAVENGTSMACPVVAGVASILLSKDKPILSMKRSNTRSSAIVQLVLRSCVPVGLAQTSEGFGRPVL